jgi:hypothetical protein
MPNELYSVSKQQEQQNIQHMDNGWAGAVQRG